MKSWDTNRIIAWGLVIMGVLSIAGWIGCSIINGSSSSTEIPIAIVSGLGGVLTGKNLDRKKDVDEKKNFE